MDIKLICPVILLLLSFVNTQNFESCVTPNRVNGLCQPIRTCASILKILQSTPISPQNRLFLQQSQCHSDVQGPWVCCETNAPTRVTTSKLPSAPNCGIDAPDRIFGGEATKIDEFPWVAQIGYDKANNKKGFHCGGSLINQRYVITAAHCIKKVPADWRLTSVRLGEWDTTTTQDCDDSYTNERICSNPHVDVPVTEKIVHENYEPNSKNQHHDIALLRLSKNVKYSEFIKPICLPLDSKVRNLNLNNVVLTVAGWGKTETRSSSTKKLKVDIKADSNSDCNIIYSRSGLQIIDGQICAGGDPGRDSCNGDSGGPLMRYYEQGTVPYFFLAGIVSYGPKNCGTKDVPGVYSRVSNYIEWIESNIKD